MKLKQVRVNGYKNLINAVLDLGDFNVLVGPNNSGKSNLLEAIQMLGGLCFGDDKLRSAIFGGLTPPSRWGSSICHLEKHGNKVITIGVSFEITVKDEAWIVNYDLSVKCGWGKKEEQGFISESLTAKQPSARGPARTYIERQDKELTVWGKEAPGIARDNSSLLAVLSLYPDFQGLPDELKEAVRAINAIGNLSVYSVAAEDMRKNVGREKPIEGLHISSFDLSLVVAKIKEESVFFELFKEHLCNILELENLVLKPVEVPLPAKKEGKESRRRQIFFLVKRKGSEYSLIDEYSDGTFAAAAILAVLISEGGKKPILCVEEPENYLHPAALRRLLNFLQDHADKWPVLITTHSSHLLNCVRNPETVKVAVVDGDGATHFEPVRNNKLLRDYLKSGFMSFGDMLPSNFEDVLGGQRSVKTKSQTSQ